jgi:hypothetical protein
LHYPTDTLARQPTDRDSFPRTLAFEKAGKIDVTDAVEKAGSMGNMPGMKM